MSTAPFFSIIVPTYNQAQYLGAALDSLMAQTDKEWEAVVVNDGSTDGTAELLEKYSQQDRRIRFFHKKNGGTASALNEGLRQAQGEWICWLSSDDMFAPRKLEIHRDWIKQYKECCFFFTYFRLLRDATGEITDHDLWGPLPDREFQITGLFYRNYISGISICVNREAWQQTGMFNESLRYAQDYDMWLRLLSVYPGVFIPEWTCINRNHALQGSEVFPQACYYDTAKAAIRFLNSRRFEELFPLLDLSDTGTAERVLARTLDIASEPTGFLYSLGPHPVLLLRIMEWIGDGPFREYSCSSRLQNIFKRHARELSCRYQGTAFGLVWKLAEATCHSPLAGFKFRAMPPVVIGKMYYFESTSSEHVEKPLRQYLLQFEHLTVQSSNSFVDNREILFIFPAEVSLSDKTTGNSMVKSVVPLAEELREKGCRVFFLGNSVPRLGFFEDFPCIGIRNELEMKEVINSLGMLDVAVAVSFPDCLQWTTAKQKLLYSQHKGSEAPDIALQRELIDNIFSVPPDSCLSPDVMQDTGNFRGRVRSLIASIKRGYRRAN
ncbi:MAG: glycosyltransferase [Nitrospirae bacterium]|nr:glycosyltransferase [Nitrospirota bacterium]